MKRLLNAFFYTPKHTKPTDENIPQLLLPSVVGIILCMVCLAGTTWAWFSASIKSPPQTITAANYDIAVAVTDEAGAPVALDQPLEAGRAYTVTLTAGGTAPSGGYCVVKSGGASLYTAPLLPGEEMSFTLIPESDDTYTFDAVWGTYNGGADITAGCTIGQIIQS